MAKQTIHLGPQLRAWLLAALAVACVTTSSRAVYAQALSEAPAPVGSSAAPVLNTPSAAAAPVPAPAAPPTLAADLFWQANDQFVAGRFAEAAGLYEQAYALSREAALLFNVAECRRRLGDCAAARAAYARYQAVEPNPPEQAVQWTLKLDEACPAAPLPPKPVPQAHPGGSATNQPTQAPAPSRAASTAPNTGGSPNAEPQPRAAGARSPLGGSVAKDAAPSRGSLQRVAGWSLLGAAVASAGVAGWYSYQLTQTEQKAEEASQGLIDSGVSWDSRGEELEQTGSRQQALGLGFALAAAGLGALGATLLLVDFETPSAPSDADSAFIRGRLSLEVTAHGSLVSWGGAL